MDMFDLQPNQPLTSWDQRQHFTNTFCIQSDDRFQGIITTVHLFITVLNLVLTVILGDTMVCEAGANELPKAVSMCRFSLLRTYILSWIRERYQ